MSVRDKLSSGGSETRTLTGSASVFMSLQLFIKREGEKISLIVDGISAQSKRVPGGDRTHLAGPLYVGGVPASLTVTDHTHTPDSEKLYLTPPSVQPRKQFFIRSDEF